MKIHPFFNPKTHMDSKLTKYEIMIQSQEEYYGLLYSISNTGFWYIDSLKYSDEDLEITGWAKAPFHEISNVTFFVNDTEFENIQYPHIRNDVGKVFSFDPEASSCGFVCRTSLKSFENDANDEIILKCVNKTTKKPFSDISQKNFYFSRNQIFNNISIPDEQRRVRVHGSKNEFTFLFTGYQLFNNCKYALKRIFNRDIDSYKNILDWGCGSGRSSRFFNQLQHASFTGVDIDQDNINWCAKNLNFGHFLTIPPFPQTSLNSSEYDLIIGISVFTHLDETTQFAWLKELKRIASDDAVLLMSVHGDTALCFSPPDIKNYNILERDGFLDIGHDASLDDVIKLNNYYRGVYHKNFYIQEKWSEYFEIIEIIPGYINNHQDLVVMRKN
jgi:2-polyprenyl-3-methyl-5-hydroxy-6-metoxy-1,4-benzoquinol methylase